VLFAFGIAKIVAGLYCRTPFPVQPMKAVGVIATTQAVQSVVIAPAAVVAASLATGLFWLLLGVTGASRRVIKLITRPVAVGIILGLGFGFMLGGMRMMASDWLLGDAGLAGTVLLLSRRRVPAMLLLLLFGVAAAAWQDPRLLQELADIRPELRLPGFALAGLRWADVGIGVFFLALPQLPLTLGNAIIAVTHENNREFPQRPVTERQVSISTGLMHLFGATVGGVPMCHGAGGRRATCASERAPAARSSYSAASSFSSPCS
jgi:predicted benzoate:H+ symporter BenE